MIRLSILFVCLFFKISQSFAQDSLGLVKFFGRTWKPASIQVIASAINDHYNHGINADQLKNHSTFSGPFINAAGLKPGYGYNWGNGGAMFSMSMSFNPISKKNGKVITGQELRFGINYYRNKNVESDQSQYENYGDTTHVKSLSYNEVMDEVAVDMAYLLKTGNIFKRFNFYFGLGLGVGTNVYGKMTEAYRDYTYVKEYINNSYNYKTIGDVEINNSYNLRHAINLRATTPIGLNFNFKNGGGIFVEVKPALYQQMVFHSNSLLRVQNTFGAGIKYTFQ